MLVSYPCNVVPFWLANLRARYFTIKPLSGGSALWSIVSRAFTLSFAPADRGSVAPYAVVPSIEN